MRKKITFIYSVTLDRKKLAFLFGIFVIVLFFPLINADSVWNDGLITYYTFENNQTNDSMSYSNLTQNGGNFSVGILGQSWREINQDSCHGLNETTRNLESIFYHTNVSFSLWINKTGEWSSGSYTNVILGFSQTSAGQGVIGLSGGGPNDIGGVSGNLSFYYATSGSPTTNTLTYSKIPVNDSKFHNIIVTMSYLSGNTTLYVDGIYQDDSTQIQAALGNEFNLGCWKENGASRMSNLTIDEVAIFNRFLNQSEVTEIYNSGIGSFPSPNISLNQPLNNENLNDTFLNIFFNFTASSLFGKLNTCELWGNWTGSFSKNYTWINPANGQMNFTQVNISSYGKYFWNVFCDIVNGHSGFSDNDFIFTIFDSIHPSITIDNIITTDENNTISFSSTALDNHFLDKCWYSIFNSSNDIDGLNSNITFTCNIETNAIVSKFGQYQLYLYVNDTYNNQNQTNNSFITSDTISPNIVIGNIANAGQTITFFPVITDPNLDKCWYSIFNSSNGIDGLNNNISFTCNTEKQATTSSIGEYNLYVFANDTSSNQNQTNKTFTITSPIPGGGGGGDEEAQDKIPVIGLRPIEGKSYPEFDRLVLYSTINNYCSEKINNQNVSVIDLSATCFLSSQDFNNIVTNLKNYKVDSTQEDIEKFYQNYKNKMIFQGFATQEDIIKFNLFSAVLGLLTTLQIPNIDKNILVYQPTLGNITITYLLTTNKVLKSCIEISQTKDLFCEIKNLTIEVSYYVEKTDFISRIFSGTLYVLTDAPPEKVEQKRISVNFRVINIGYNNLIIYMGLFGIFLFIFFIFKNHKKRKIRGLLKLEKLK